MKNPKPSSSSRRQFLKTGIKASAAMSFLSTPFMSLGQPVSSVHTRSPHPLKILILGGTSFLGPHQIAYALNRGHSITTFTRGKTEPSVHKKLFKEVEQLTGDREDNLEALKGRRWDAVIDNSGHRVHWTKATAELLKDHVDLYLYTSSTGVYYPYLETHLRENKELVLEVPENATEEEKGEYDYGVMKANSELEVQKAFGKERAILVRPTYMLGPADRTNRSFYWPMRMSRGGEILIPGKRNDQVQFIDVRDMAEFMIRLIENRKGGVYNGVGPISSMGLHEFVYGVKACFSTDASFAIIEDYEFLQSQNLTYAIPWVMPVDDHLGTSKVINLHSLNNGLTFRPLVETVVDSFEFWHSDAVSDERRERLVSGEGALMGREAEILAEWRKR